MHILSTSCGYFPNFPKPTKVVLWYLVIISIPHIFLFASLAAMTRGVSAMTRDSRFGGSRAFGAGRALPLALHSWMHIWLKADEGSGSLVSQTRISHLGVRVIRVSRLRKP